VLNTYTDFSAPYDAIELPDGSILVADCALGRLTQILDQAGINRRTVAESLSCPTGLALVNNSTMLVTEFKSHQLIGQSSDRAAYCDRNELIFSRVVATS